MTSTRPRISALLVCHNGARWLPTALAAHQAAQTRPDRWVVVDTGSSDASGALVAEGLVDEDVTTVVMPSTTTYGQAVRAGLEALSATDGEEWIWLLHDDCSPDRDCLEHLVEIVTEGEDGLAVVGPKLREWPSLQRLLEVGVTITGTGRRLTGLESGEYDQGQHDDEYSAVLAVNTAGMLARRDVLAEFGFADELPLFGNDIDFGWRLASAGLLTRIVPTAVLFHAEAAHRGQRDATLAANPHRDERISAMFTVLTNGSARWHPVRMVRLFLGGLLRALGFLLVRAPGEARAEIEALVHVYGRVPTMRGARRARRDAAKVPDFAITPLLAPFWMPWRHGLDFVVDVGRAIYDMGRESAARHRVDDGTDAPWLKRTALRPATWAVLITIVLAFVAGRDLLSGPQLRGGGLLPAPGSVVHWWHLWSAHWHWVGEGSAMPAAPYTLPLAVAGTLTLANPGLLIWLLFIMTVPLSIVGAVRLGRHVGLRRTARVWAAVTYALLPVLSGAVGNGRLGTVVIAVLLPWVVTTAWHLDARSTDRRRRALWRTILGIGILGCFLPVLFFAGVFLAVAAQWLPTRLERSERGWLALGPLALIIPWLPAVLAHPQLLLFEAGVTRRDAPSPGILQLFALNDGGPGAAPWWLTLVIPVLALIALLRADTRRRVVNAWIVVALLAVIVAVLARVNVTVPGSTDALRPPVDALLVLMGGALLIAIAWAANGFGSVVRENDRQWWRVLGVVACVAALIVPVGGAVWWVGHGTQGQLHRADGHQLPAYLVDLAAASPSGATLVLASGRDGALDPTIRYSVFRSGELRIGDDSVLASTAPDQALRAAVGSMLGPESAGSSAVLAARGIAYVFMAPPVASGIAGAIDAAPGLAAASAPDPRTRAWTVSPAPNLSALPTAGHWWQGWLVGAEVLALIAILVLVVPGRRTR